MNFELLENYLKFKAQIKKGLAKGPVEKALEYPKSCGAKIIDLTCGTGKDAMFFLALGYHVDAYERNNLIFERLKYERDFFLEQVDLKTNFRIFNGEFSWKYIEETLPLPYLYFDPMYSVGAGKKSKDKAKSRKEMQIFKEIVGSDNDQKQFIQKIYDEKKFKRLLIKRPVNAVPLIPMTKGRDISYMGKTVRIDTYLL